jgi:hypothetical protein
VDRRLVPLPQAGHRDARRRRRHGAFKELTPVTYAYRADPTEHHAGFIAEDVPDLVASGDRTGLAPMDVVAVLTKVVQEQQKNMEIQQRTIESQQAQLAELRNVVEKLAASR